MSVKIVLCFAAVSASALLGSNLAAAEQTGASNGDAAPGALDEVIVTARKRQESILNVPVVETVIPKAQLEHLQVQDLGDLSSLVPGLDIGRGVLATGGQISIRGVGTISVDVGVDQSVAYNIDGMSFGTGLALQSGMFDVQQVEVLKGPQSLFYGKSSTGGVLSLRTVDPTNAPEVIAQLGYEIESVNPEAELIVSGPLTDTLKARIAGMYSWQRGYFENEAYPDPGTGAVAPRYSRDSQTSSYKLRGTLLWNPTDIFDARLKINLAQDDRNQSDMVELTSCPEGISAPAGIPFIGGAEDCKLNRRLSQVEMDPKNFPGILNAGSPFLNTHQRFGTLELNYHITAPLTLSSTTGYYDVTTAGMNNGTNSTYAGPAFAAENWLDRYDFTEELRLNSDWASPVNFTVGGFYEKGRTNYHVSVVTNTNFVALGLPPNLDANNLIVVPKTYSAFGQIRLKIVPSLELALGARYSDERRTEQAFSDFSLPPALIPIGTPEVVMKNTTPDATLTFRPSEDMTLFAAFRQAYKSGGFALADQPSADGVLNNAYGEEKATGGEIGLKSRWLDRRLLVDVAPYYYRYAGLQVSAVEPPAPNGLVGLTTENAGAARSYGIDFDATYYPQAFEGLSLDAAANWNNARFQKLDNVPCYGGQTINMGCNQALNPLTGLFTAQNLAGTPLVRAPDWQANVGFGYEVPLSGGYKATFTNNNSFSSSYVTTLAANYPGRGAYQKAFAKVDLGVTVASPKDQWEVSIIGRNLSDQITAGSCLNSNFANGGVLGGEITGGTGRGPAGIDEIQCYANPGREVWLRLTYQPLK